MSSTHRLRASGWLFIASALTFVGYAVLAGTVGRDYEDDLNDAADELDVAVNKLPAPVNADIVQDHTTYSIVTNIYLFLPALLLVWATVRLRSVVRDFLAGPAVLAAVAALLVWCFYDALNFGLFADRDDLPPLVRDLDDLTVPLVTINGVLALVALTLAAEATRRDGLLRRAAIATEIVSAIVFVASVVSLIASGFDDPIPPIVIIPGGLILGIALLRRREPSVA